MKPCRIMDYCSGKKHLNFEVEHIYNGGEWWSDCILVE